MQLTITMAQLNSQNNGHQNVGDGQCPVESTEIPVTSLANPTSSASSTSSANPTSSASSTSSANPTSSTSSTSPVSPVNSTASGTSTSQGDSTSSITATSPAVPTLSLTLTSPVNQTISVTATLPVTSPVTRPLPPISTSSEIPQTRISRPLPPISTSSSIPQSSATPVTYEQTAISDGDSQRCGRCRSLGRTIFSTSPDKYCCIIPAKIWLKIRLLAIILLLVGLFLVIIFPLPGMILFQIALALLTVSSTFVLIDIVRAAIANCWCERFNTPQTQPERVRTIEVIGNTGFEEYDNPAFQGDHPPDYATAIATTPAPHDHGHQRPPNITINIEPSDHGTSDDVRTNVAFDSSISPSSVFSFNEPYSPRSLPPSYDDVIKEDNERQNARQHDGHDDGTSPGPSSS